MCLFVAWYFNTSICGLNHDKSTPMQSRLRGLGCSSVGRALDRYAAEPVRFPGMARDFSSRVNFQCRLSYGVRTLPSAIACINISAHVKDPVVHVRVRLDFGNTKTPSMHSRLGSAPWRKSPWDRNILKSSDIM